MTYRFKEHCQHSCLNSIHYAVNNSQVQKAEMRRAALLIQTCVVSLQLNLRVSPFHMNQSGQTGGLCIYFIYDFLEDYAYVIDVKTHRYAISNRRNSFTLTSFVKCNSSTIGTMSAQPASRKQHVRRAASVVRYTRCVQA